MAVKALRLQEPWIERPFLCKKLQLYIWILFHSHPQPMMTFWVPSPEPLSVQLPQFGMLLLQQAVSGLHQVHSPYENFFSILYEVAKKNKSLTWRQKITKNATQHHQIRTIWNNRDKSWIFCIMRQIEQCHILVLDNCKDLPLISKSASGSSGTLGSSAVKQ